MKLSYLRVAGVYSYPPEVGAGMTDNGAGSVTEGASAASTTGNVTSGTASEAMIKAATAASSAEGSSAAKVEDTTGGAGIVAGAKAGAIVPPKPGEADGAKGEAPEARIQAAVKNAREQTRAEVEKTYEWAKGVSAEDGRTAIGILGDLKRDPKAFYAELGQLLGIQGAAGGKEAAAEEVAPPPDLVSPDGKLKTYSDATLQKVFDIRERQLTAKLMGELRPTLDYIGSQREGQEKERVQRESRASATEILTEMRALPHFTKENETKINEYFRAIPVERRSKIGSRAALYEAYNTFLSKDVFPTIDTSAETRVREENRKKAATSRGSAHPGDSGGDGKTAPLNSVNDLARHMERLAAQP